MDDIPIQAEMSAIVALDFQYIHGFWLQRIKNLSAYIDQIGNNLADISVRVYHDDQPFLPSSCEDAPEPWLNKFPPAGCANRNTLLTALVVGETNAVERVGRHTVHHA